jgi:hypothetical protein
VSDKKFKQSIVVEGDITSTNLEANRALISDADKKIVESAVTSTELGHLSGVTSAIQTQLDAKVDESREGQANGIATLDAGGKVPVTQLPNSVMEFQGAWNASTNSPTLADGTGNQGDVYRVSVAGTQNLGSGSQAFDVGDFAIYNGSIWQWSGGSDAVMSVFGRQGTVTAQNGDYTASQVTNVPAGTIAATTVQAAVNELDGDVVAAQSSIDNHIADTSDAHDASAISNIPSGNLAATDVQAALNELQSDVDTRATTTALNNHINDTSDAHDASAISVVPAGNLTSTDVQSALEEIQTELDNFNPGSPGDIQETSFSLANNQASPANVTGLAFSGAVRSFEALVSVEIDAASDLFEVFKLYGIRRGADWQMSVESTGDNSLVAFTITSGGQVTYTSGNYATFVSGAIKFRAETTSTT